MTSFFISKSHIRIRITLVGNWKLFTLEVKQKYQCCQLRVLKKTGIDSIFRTLKFSDIYKQFWVVEQWSYKPEITR